LAAALDEFEKGFPPVKGPRIGEDSITGETVYEDVGRGLTFQRLANRHFKALEKELGNKDPGRLYPEALADIESGFPKG
jgi:hypothetical protein